jgi:hypothetical protein
MRKESLSVGEIPPFVCLKSNLEPLSGSGTLSATCSSRNGERHPGLQDAVSLRGRAEQCEPWSVRFRLQGARPRQADAPTTTGVLWENEEGNVVGVRQAHALFEVTPKKRCPERGHVLHSVQRPVHVNRH